MSLINKEVADFTVKAYQNDNFHDVSKKDILGKWSVFFFYPADFTFVCPTELADLADKYEEFKKIGCEIFSVSCDSHFVHKAWHDASDTIKKLQYPMLADPNHQLSRDFQVLIENFAVFVCTYSADGAVCSDIETGSDKSAFSSGDGMEESR